MRPLLIFTSTVAITVIAAFLWLASVLDAPAQQRYWEDGDLPPLENGYAYPPGHDSYIGIPRSEQPRRYRRTRHYRKVHQSKRRHRTVRQYKKRYSTRRHRHGGHIRRGDGYVSANPPQIYDHDYATPRTKFCRHHVERRYHRKVVVSRCIWVRNDLLHHYRDGGW